MPKLSQGKTSSEGVLYRITESNPYKEPQGQEMDQADSKSSMGWYPYLCVVVVVVVVCSNVVLYVSTGYISSFRDWKVCPIRHLKSYKYLFLKQREFSRLMEYNVARQLQPSTNRPIP